MTDRLLAAVVVLTSVWATTVGRSDSLVALADRGLCDAYVQWTVTVGYRRVSGVGMDRVCP